MSSTRYTIHGNITNTKRSSLRCSRTEESHFFAVFLAVAIIVHLQSGVSIYFLIILKILIYIKLSRFFLSRYSMYVTFQFSPIRKEKHTFIFLYTHVFHDRGLGSMYECRVVIYSLFDSRLNISIRILFLLHRLIVFIFLRLLPTDF